MKLQLLTFWTQVRIFWGHFLWITSKFENSEYIKDLEPNPNTVNPSERAIPEELDRAASLQTLEGSTEYHVMFSASNAPEIEVAGLEHEHITELQQLLSETLAVQTEQDRRLAKLTDELALKSALLEQANTNAAEVKRSAELERRENSDRLLVQTSLVKQKDAELGRLQAKPDGLLLSRVQDVRALDQARSALPSPISRTADTDANADRYERSQHAYEQVAKYETEVAELRAELEAKKSELETFRSRLMDAQNGRAKSGADAEAGSLQDQVTLWRNKYEALAKLYRELRTEHLDLLSTSKQLQLKASAQTTAGESVHGS